MTQLTDQQQQALEKIGDWFYGDEQPPKPFYLAGPAGTGKTTLAREVAAALGVYDVLFAAYTGKAAAGGARGARRPAPCTV